MKKRILSLLFCAAMALSLFACTIQEPGSSETPEESPPQTTQTESTEPEPSEAGNKAVQSGTYTLPCGMKIQFFDSVRNDATGRWRRAATSDSYVPADYALEYYNEMFSSDDEIHSIWNATLGTNTRISVVVGVLCVDTLEYVSGEEHDANLMFSGELLDSRMIDIATGELIEE